MYLSWSEQTITDFSDSNINALYNRGFVFTRRGKGVMNQTRSIRIDLAKFELSSENRRVLKKTEDLNLSPFPLPLSSYHWSIGKMAKDFYDTKFGEGTFSANKIKELMTSDKSNFNFLLIFENCKLKIKNFTIGYSICHQTNELLHYSYPFYILNSKFNIPNLGLGMMLRAILYAQEQGKKYIYLGSFQRPTDVYKLQFKGLEWFDGEKWTEDLEELKQQIKQ
jgi:arginyl-tRNA--protein-N-Asp/Glu arginylyltransferase